MHRPAPAQAVRRHFAERLAASGFRADAAQSSALDQLADWLESLLSSKRGWLRRPVGGLYLWGGVGRGKSFVMDCFFLGAPLAAKRRVHFHAFLQELQVRLLAHTGQPDPLARVAAELAGEVRLLCFDEFHVHDIGDAILLGRLLEALLQAQVGVVVTSNYVPASLCPNPLHHERFKPFIRVLEKHMRIVELDGGVDYRSRSVRDWGQYHWPESPQSLQDWRRELGLGVPAASLAVNRLSLQPLGLDARSLWLDFAALFPVPSSTRDYLWLCERFERIAISGLPCLDRHSADVRQRFLNFVDIAYDAGVELLLSSRTSLDELCRERPHEDFARTRSRLAQLRPRLLEEF
ncbi:cell division protein ZapE [Azotobacter salinestris]|uniref:cell division protein ZapE n=1 Tax=Azotobacter salinestris TaxID=69964 RepID=UPI0032DEFB4C